MNIHIPILDYNPETDRGLLVEYKRTDEVIYKMHVTSEEFINLEGLDETTYDIIITRRSHAGMWSAPLILVVSAIEESENAEVQIIS